LRFTPYAVRKRGFRIVERWGVEVSIFKKEVKELGNVPKIDFHDG
jgi:putative transposon-encoded protein